MPNGYEASVSGQIYSSLPILDFGSTDLSNENAGFAGAGFGAGIHIDYTTPHVQWMVQFNYFSNALRTDELARDLQARDSVQYTVEADNFQARNIMVGAGVPLIEKERFRIQLAGLAGMTFISRPQVNYSMLTANGPIRFTESKASDIEFSYSLQLQGVYDLPSGFFVRSQVVYIASETGFQYRTSKGGSLSRETVHQPFFLLGMSLGIGFAF